MECDDAGVSKFCEIHCNLSVKFYIWPLILQIRYKSDIIVGWRKCFWQSNIRDNTSCCDNHLINDLFLTIHKVPVTKLLLNCTSNSDTTSIYILRSNNTFNSIASIIRYRSTSNSQGLSTGGYNHTVSPTCCFIRQKTSYS